MKEIVTDNFYYVKMSISVQFTGYGMQNINGDLLANCERNGCRDDAFQRSPFSCQPSPSRSFSPSPTLSKTPSPTSSRSKSPSPTASKSQSAPFNPSTAFVPKALRKPYRQRVRHR
jgi:hypothetical protein